MQQMTLLSLQLWRLISDIQWYLCVPAFVHRWEDKETVWD